MADLVFLALIVVFFEVALLLVRGCERILGPDPVGGAVPAAEPRSDLVSAA